MSYCIVSVDLLKTYKQPSEHSSYVCTLRRGTRISFTRSQDNSWGYHPGAQSFYFRLGGVTMLHGTSTSEAS